jgi:hypothetical protein
MKYGLNKIKKILNTQQVGWLSGKGVKFHPWGSKDQTSQMIFIVVDNGIFHFLLILLRLNVYLGRLSGLLIHLN